MSTSMLSNILILDEQPSADTVADTVVDTVAIDAVLKMEKLKSPCLQYKDYSHLPDPDPSKPVTAYGRIPNFPAKLFAILSRPELADIVSWLPHGRSWKVHKPREFEVKVVPAYFDHAKFSSFIRQANGWGFRRLTAKGPDRNSHYSELFLRGMPHLLKIMKRPGASGKAMIKQQHQKLQSVSSSSLDDSKAAFKKINMDPDFYGISQKHPLPEPKNCAPLTETGPGGAPVTAHFIAGRTPSSQAPQHVSIAAGLVVGAPGGPQSGSIYASAPLAIASQHLMAAPTSSTYCSSAHLRLVLPRPPQEVAPIALTLAPLRTESPSATGSTYQPKSLQAAYILSQRLQLLPQPAASPTSESAPRVLAQAPPQASAASAPLAITRGISAGEAAARRRNSIASLHASMTGPLITPAPLVDHSIASLKSILYLPPLSYSSGVEDQPPLDGLDPLHFLEDLFPESPTPAATTAADSAIAMSMSPLHMTPATSCTPSPPSTPLSLGRTTQALPLFPRMALPVALHKPRMYMSGISSTPPSATTAEAFFPSSMSEDPLLLNHHDPSHEGEYSFEDPFLGGMLQAGDFFE